MLRFTLGRDSIRFTADFLESGRLIFQPYVSAFLIHHLPKVKLSQGATDFVYWHINQVQYKNPKVQVNVLMNKTPSPFIGIFFTTGKKLWIDVDSMPRDRILNHLIDTVGLTERDFQQLRERTEARQRAMNALFGFEHSRYCMCEIPGHRPCSSRAAYPEGTKAKEIGFGRVYQSSLRYRLIDDDPKGFKPRDPFE